MRVAAAVTQRAGPRRAAARIGAPLRGMRSLLSNAGSMMGSVVLTSALGFPYWWIAARTFSAGAVGFAAATISATSLLATCGTLGMGTFLTGELPRQSRDRGPVITTALAAAACAGLVLGLLFALVMPGPLGLHAMDGRPGAVVLFAAGVALTSLTMVADQALIGLLRGGLQLRRNAIFAIAKLAALAAVGFSALSKGGLAIYTTTVVGMAISIVWLILAARREGAHLLRCRPRLGLLWRWRLVATEHHVLNLALLAPARALPVIAAGVIGVTASAYYYTASLIMGVLAYGGVALTYALYAVAARDPGRLAHTLRFTIRLAFAILLLANLMLFFGAGVILRVFGPQYAAHGATVLRILGVDALLTIVKDHYVAIARIRGTLGRATVVAGAGAVLEILFGAIGGALEGVTGLALGALVGLACQIAVMSPIVIRELRGDRLHQPAVSPERPLADVSS